MSTPRRAGGSNRRRTRGGVRYGLAAAAALLIAAGAGYVAVSGGAVPTVGEAVAVNSEAFSPLDHLALAHADARVAVADSSFPEGASSLNETYKDWRVACALQANAKRCAVSQTQLQQNGQRVLAIELNVPRDNAVSGTLVLPFGLALEAGITLQVDDKPAMKPLRFRTCLPGGCLVNLAFDASMLDALRAGAVLKIKAVADDGATAPFTVSLQGFGTALDRVQALSR